MNRKENIVKVIAKAAEVRTQTSLSRLKSIIINWDYQTYGKISVRKIAAVSDMNIKTVAKYYPQFKADIETSKFEYKLTKKNAPVASLSLQIQDELQNEVEVSDKLQQADNGVLIQPLEYFVHHYGEDFAQELYEGQF